MTPLEKQIRESMARMAKLLKAEDEERECPYKVDAPSEYGHYRGDRWDQALSRIHRNGLI